MATNVTYNGVTYSVPQNGNSGWGTQLTAYLVALASGSLTKAGGVVTLTANLDLGANYGIKSIFFSDRGTAASAGIVRLSNNTAVSWRNAANDGNLDLTVNSSNVLMFNSLPIAALALGAANTVLKMNSGGTAFEYGTLVNANINASAAIAYSKLNLATSIVNADVSGSAAIAYSKLNLATSIVNADVSGSAAIDGSKLVAATNSVAGAVTTDAQSFAGLKTFYDGLKLDDDADQDALTYYRTANQSLNWQFNGTTPGVAVANSTRITRIGNIVHFHLGTARANTGTTSTILSSEAWPSWAWPVRTTVIKGVHIRNGGTSDTTSIGVFQINVSDGVAYIYRDLSLTAFTNSTNCGVQTSFSGCYAIE